MQNCILDKFTFITLCEIFSLLIDFFDQTIFKNGKKAILLSE